MDTPSTYLFANWKAYFTREDVESWISYFNEQYVSRESIVVGLGPSFVNIQHIINECTHDDVMVYAQDVSSFEPGAFTGEITIEDLQSQMVDAVLIGHSERRSHMHESMDMINTKIERTLDSDLTAIVAISKIEQLSSVLDSGHNVKDIIWAFEPIDSIGNGKPASQDRVEQFLQDMYHVAGNDITVIYGGSVDSNNINDYLTIDGIQGALIATASKDPKEFISIINTVSQN